ncbi:MAG TPA: hydrogenase maturation nickel metallochaperone HypA [Bryobacteraceae bacterium]|nr:hydrogenase maturation nickel metallochaperone HypA [Bryobacteraceae bacterium]
MHELSIVHSLIEAVQKEMTLRPSARLKKVGLRIGEFAGIDDSSLRFCFDVLVRDTEFRAASLDIERGSRDELDLSYLEVEEDEPDSH